MNRTFIIAFAVAAAACGDDPRTSGPIVDNNGGANNGGSNNGASNNGASNNGTPNNGASNNGTSNNGTPNNGTSNNGATNNGATNNLPSGEVCELVNTDRFRGMCDPVRNAGCMSGETCLIALLLNGPEVDVSSWCDETDRHTLPEGAECNGTEQRCAPGLFCIDFLGTCQKLCYFDGGVGCEADEWCNQADEQWKGIGYCNDQCDPLE